MPKTEVKKALWETKDDDAWQVIFEELVARHGDCRVLQTDENK